MDAGLTSLLRKLAAVLLLAAAVLAAVLLFWRSSQGPGTDQAIAPEDAAVDAAQSATTLSALPELPDMDRPTLGLPTPGCEDVVAERRRRLARYDHDELARDVVKTLSPSGNAELLLAAALLTREEDVADGLFDSVLRLDPDNRIALWHQLQNCVAGKMPCDPDTAEAAAIAADAGNGLVWLELARRQIREERWQDAEESLQRAAAAHRFDTYFIEHAVVVERGLAAASELSYPERMIAGIGVSAAIAIPAFGDVSRACSKDAEQARISVDVCTELGEQMAESSRELLTSMIGYAIWRNSEQRSGDEERARQIGAEMDRVRASFFEEAKTSGAWALVENDVTVLQDYVDNFLAHGEIRAAKMLVQDARRLRTDPDYDQCNFVGNAEWGS